MIKPKGKTPARMSNSSRAAARPLPSKQSPVPAANALKSYADRIDRLEEERQAIGGDVKDVYTEVKSAGFNPKALRKVLAERRRKTDAQLDAEVEAYRAALDGSSYRAAAERLGVSKSKLQRLVPRKENGTPHDPETGEITETPVEGARPEEVEQPSQAAPPATLPVNAQRRETMPGSLPPLVRKILGVFEGLGDDHGRADASDIEKAGLQETTDETREIARGADGGGRVESTHGEAEPADDGRTGGVLAGIPGRDGEVARGGGDRTPPAERCAQEVTPAPPQSMGAERNREPVPNLPDLRTPEEVMGEMPERLRRVKDFSSAAGAGSFRSQPTGEVPQ